jgi:hypothetical protein
MKALLLTSLLLSITAGAQARSILVFRPSQLCQNKTATVEIQEAQDGQSRMIVDIKSEKLKLDLIGKKVPMEAGRVGGITRYVGKDKATNIEGILAITAGTAPIKIGKVVGRPGKLELVGRSELVLACNNIK